MERPEREATPVRLTREILSGVLLLSAPSFEDDRGIFSVPFEERAAAQLGLPSHFVQDNHSMSISVGTVRGIHLQVPPFSQGKLVRVLRGRIVDVVVDLRPSSATRGCHEVMEMSADGGELLWIPAGFGHGFCTLEPYTEVFYKVDAPYMPAAERTLAWNDPAIGITWPPDMGEPVLSAKDADGLSFQEILAELDAIVGVIDLVTAESLP